jgi:hypothetical protein
VRMTWPQRAWHMRSPSIGKSNHLPGSFDQKPHNPLKKSTLDIRPVNSRCIYLVWALNFSTTLSFGHIGSMIVDWCAGFISFASTQFPHKTYKQHMPASFSGSLTLKYYTINGKLNTSSSSIRVFTKSHISQLKLFK